MVLIGFPLPCFERTSRVAVGLLHHPPPPDLAKTGIISYTYKVFPHTYTQGKNLSQLGGTKDRGVTCPPALGSHYHRILVFSGILTSSPLLFPSGC